MNPTLATVLGILSPTITIITVLIGLAAMWGKLSTIVETIKTQVDRLARTVEENHVAQTSFREHVLVRFAEMGKTDIGGRVLVKRQKKARAR